MFTACSVVSRHVANSHFADEGHGYQLSKRQAMYPFMVKHMGLDATGVLDKSTGAFDESKTVLEKPELMRVFDAQHPLPRSCPKAGIDGGLLVLTCIFIKTGLRNGLI